MDSRTWRLSALVLAIVVVVLLLLRAKDQPRSDSPLPEAVNTLPAQPGKLNEFASGQASAEAPQSKPQADPQISPPLPAQDLAELRSQAKSALSALYSSQKAFFSEYNRFSTDLKAIGWSPLDPTMAFKIGFINPYQPQEYGDSGFHEDPRRVDSDVFLHERAEANETYSYAAGVQELRLGDFEHLCQMGCTANDQHFEVLVVMPIGRDGAYDVWTINDQKQITLVQDGLSAAK